MSVRSVAYLVAAVAAPVLAVAMARPAAAQSVESDLTSESAHLVKDVEHYGIPDLGEELLKSADYTDQHDRFSIKFGLALLAGDYTTFEQDDASREQVGVQHDKFEARSLRLMARGHFELFRRWNYQVSYEYNGFDSDSIEPNWSATDMKISTDLEGLGTLSIGKMKEPHVYEMVGDAANLPQSERLLSPFFKSRNIGLSVSNTYADQRGTITVGWYNDWLVAGEDFQQSGNDFAARVTALPVWSDDGARYLHMAASVRYYGADNNELRFRGKPATNVSDYYVDTDKFAGDHAWNTGLELLWNVDGLSLLGEYVTSSVSAPAYGNPDFNAWYLTGSWVITGEHRPYDRKAGYARRVLPQGQWGAWEIVGRYGRVDLNDAGMAAGAMDGWWAGVNWWATNRWKAGLVYGDIDLDRFDVTGNTRTFLARIQWIY
jgi:phosphate-selective porin